MNTMILNQSTLKPGVLWRLGHSAKTEFKTQAGGRLAGVELSGQRCELVCISGAPPPKMRPTLFRSSGTLVHTAQAIAIGAEQSALARESRF